MKDGHKLNYAKLHIRKRVFTVTVVKHWNTLPREVMESPPSEIFRTQLDMVLGNIL